MNFKSRLKYIEGLLDWDIIFGLKNGEQIKAMATFDRRYELNVYEEFVELKGIEGLGTEFAETIVTYYFPISSIEYIAEG